VLDRIKEIAILYNHLIALRRY